MEIEQSRSGSVALVKVKGTIKLSTSGREFSDYLERLLKTDGCSVVLLDFSMVDYIDSTGLGELVAYLRKFHRQNRRIAVLEPAVQLMKLFRFMKLEKALPIFETTEHALAVLGE